MNWIESFANGPLSFTYDDTNRMTEAFASGVRFAAYTYNARGERVKKAGAEGVSFPKRRTVRGLALSGRISPGGAHEKFEIHRESDCFDSEGGRCRD